MNKTLRPLFFVLLSFLLSSTCVLCRACIPAIQEQQQREKTAGGPDTFSKNIKGKNNILNLEYRRYGDRAIVYFDVTGNKTFMVTIYVLAYEKGSWKICQTLRYSNTTQTAPA